MLVIVDTGGANIGSIQFCLQRLGVESALSKDPAHIASADKVILPGVGAAADSMARLARAELIDPLRNLSQPVLGICLGMQLLYESSEEGQVSCLAVVPGRIAKLQPEPGIRVPHMGWNQLNVTKKSPLLRGIADDDSFYFVHSFAAPRTDDSLALTRHGTDFASVVQRGNFYGAQFHPERSSTAGARLIRNFLEL